MSRYWHFLITHSLKRQGSHEQDERKINARWMLKVISDAPNRTESRSPRFCAQGIRSYGVSGNSAQNQLMISWEGSLHTCVIISHSLFFTTLFKKPMKPPTLEFFEQQKQVIVQKHPSYRHLKIVIWKEIKHWPSVHLYLILLVAAQMFLRVSAEKVSILIYKSFFI